MKEITIFSRSGCHLCEVAREEIERIAKEGDFEVSLKEILIDGNQELENEYGFMVPVIHIDGAMHGYGRVEEARLRKALAI
jgi:glutaredoxin